MFFDKLNKRPRKYLGGKLLLKSFMVKYCI